MYAFLANLIACFLIFDFGYSEIKIILETCQYLTQVRNILTKERRLIIVLL